MKFKNWIGPFLIVLLLVATLYAAMHFTWFVPAKECGVAITADFLFNDWKTCEQHREAQGLVQ